MPGIPVSPKPGRPPVLKKVFEFLSLPRELRDIIYEFSLMHNRSQRRFANLALMRVSKQVNLEAKDIFPHESTFSLSVSARRRWPGALSYRPLSIEGDMRHVNYLESHLGSFENIFPPVMSRMKQLELEVDICLHVTYEYIELQHFLYGLASTLEESPKEKVVVKVSNLADECDLMTMKMMYPLIKIPTSTELILIGLPRQVVSQLRQLRADQHKWPVLSFNVLREWRDLRDVIKTQLLNSKIPDRGHLQRIFASFRFLDLRLEPPLMPDLIEPADEEALMKPLKLLRAVKGANWADEEEMKQLMDLHDGSIRPRMQRWR